MNWKAAGLGIAAIAATLVPVQAVAAGECPTDEACLVVTVKGPTPSITAITYSNLHDNADVHDAPYRLRGAGEAPATHDGTVETGLSLNKLLNLNLNLDPSAVDRLNLDVPGKAAGTKTTPLTPKQLGPAASNGYADGLEPALTLENGQIGYIRPLTDGSTTDVNAGTDSWSAPGQVVRMTIWTSVERITGHVVASSPTVKPKGTVRFSVAFDGQPDTSDLKYRWTFCDGSTADATSATPVRTWTKPAKNCRVSVVVNGVGFTSDIEPATVQAATTITPATATPTTKPTKAPRTPTGPVVKFAHIDQNDLKILGGSALPQSAGEPVLTAPVDPNAPVAGEPLTLVSGAFLEAASGETSPTSDGQVPPALEKVATPAKKKFSSSGLLWLLAPVLVIAGALVELRPRQRKTI